MAGRIPVGDLGVVGLGSWEQRILEDTRIAGLVEGENVDVVTLIFLDDSCSILIGVETVHQNEGHVDIVGSVEVFDLADGKIKEGHAVSNFDNGLGADTTHGSTETTIELDHSKLVEVVDGITVGELVVVDDLFWGRRVDLGPVDGVALCLIIQVSSEESKEVVHLGFESLLLGRVGDCVCELIEGISHLAGCDVGGGIFESLCNEAFG